MPRKSLVILFLSCVALTSISFISGLLYERWQESKNTLDIDHSLVVLLAKPSDFEIPGGKWVNTSYYQSYYDPIFSHIDDYKVAGYSSTAYFPATETLLGVGHDIRRYVPDKTPKTTLMDEYYRGAKATNGMEIHWLNLKDLDKKSRAFCASSKSSKTINCYVESKYDEIISTFSIWANNMTEEQVINFIMPAIQKFYDRLSKSSIK